MGFIVMAGERANHLEGAASGGVTGSSEDTFYLWENQRGPAALDPWRPGRMLTPGTDDAVIIDKNYIGNFGAETGDTAPWIIEVSGGSPGSVTAVASPVNTGAFAFKLMTGLDESLVTPTSMYQDIKVRPGEIGTVSVALRGDGTRTIRAMAYILETGQYLTSGGALSLTPQDFATRVTATYATTTITWTPPAYTKQWPIGIWTVRFTCYINNAATGEGFMDDFVYWPHTNSNAVIGHNLMPALTAFVLQRSTDAVSWTTEHTYSSPLYSPNMYGLHSTMRTERYWRYLTTGINGAYALWFGQLWLFQKLLFDRSPNYGFREALSKDYKEQRTTAGATRRYYKEDTPRTDLIFTWRHPTDADYEELRDRVFRQGRLGEWPALIIRATTDPQSAHMVNIPGEYVTDFIEAAPSDADGRARDAGEMTFPGLAYPTFMP